MSDLVALQLRQPPWKPTPDTEVVAEYQYYDVPLTGVIRQGETEYLFSCLDGHDDTLSLWWFVAITPEQRAQIEGCEHPDYDQLLRTMNFKGWSRLAFATQRLGLVDVEDVEDVPRGGQHALRALKERVSRMGSDAQELELSRA